MVPRKREVSGLVVLKLGGSLLDLPELRQRLDDVLRRYNVAPCLLVVGGGAAADMVRGWDRLHELGDETAHRLALEAMSLNARFVSALLPQANFVADLRECENPWQSRRPAVIDPALFVPSLEATCRDPLPHTWEATSDSISAWIASQLDADRLVLLKSTDSPDGGLLSSKSHHVDAAFDVMCHRVGHVEWINLRATIPESSDVRIQ